MHCCTSRCAKILLSILYFFISWDLTAETPLFSSDFENSTGDNAWTTVSTALTGDWVIIDPNQTTYQPNTGNGGSANALITGQNTSIGADDVDGGLTSIRSNTINLNTGFNYQLDLAYFFARANNANSGDFFRLTIESPTAADSVLIFIEGNGTTNPFTSWTESSFDISAFAGHSITILAEAQDDAIDGSLVEAGIDDVIISRSLNCDAGNEYTYCYRSKFWMYKYMYRASIRYV